MPPPRTTEIILEYFKEALFIYFNPCYVFNSFYVSSRVTGVRVESKDIFSYLNPNHLFLLLVSMALFSPTQNAVLRRIPNPLQCALYPRSLVSTKQSEI